ncbi:MAG: HAMP domain-containing protein [bacterium]|nr:HAMP domain-containing protein [bacterium]
MTLRLIALMSVVLLLSLGAFGLLMAHYQDQVMEEVARTASAVGQATLRTFEFSSEEDPDFRFHEAANYVDFMWTDAADGPPPPASAIEDGHVVVIDHFASPRRVEIVAEALGHGHPGPKVSRRTRRAWTQEDGAIVAVECQGSSEEKEATCVQTAGEIDPAEAAKMFIRIDDVRAETDAGSGLVLKFPVMQRVFATDNHFELHGEIDAAAVGDDRISDLETIQLPIPVEEYDSLFDRIRDRSLFLFFGVFVVGTVLSAGVATRFTKPIRRLHAGIRDISAGDLDTEVDVRGHDEIARLGTALNDMARELRANRDRAREMMRREKLTALGRLAAGVAHDVRNPLHSIGLTLQHLRETSRPENDDRAAQFDRSIDIIRGEIRRLDRTVANFLRFATNDRGEQVVVDLCELLRETATLVRKEAEWRGVEVTLQVDESVSEIAADGEAIRSSILNLVLNSFEAMPGGGTLTLSLRTEGGYAVVEVADSGRGIDPRDQERAFDFGYTTRDGGNGLGLAIVHQCVVEEHGGRVSLDSAPGEGTRVSLALPLEAEPKETDS